MISLGDVISLRFIIKLIRNRLGFQSKFLEKFGSGFLLLVTKSIKLATNIIEKFKFDKKRSNLYQNCSKLIEKVKIYFIDFFNIF